nr:type II secretion system protein [Marinobacter sp. P4B1]
MRQPCLGKPRQQGATLVELVMTIVIIGVAIAGVVGAFSLITGRSADPLNQTRAVALAQLYMDEILARNYDESSKVGGGKVSSSQVDCEPAETSSQPRADYEDVNDYHAITNAIPEDGEGNPLPGYGNFRISITVACAGNDISEMPLANADAKRIDITITDPSNATYQFSAYRGNF